MTDVISSHIAKFFQIWLTIAGYDELCVGFSQSEMEKYFEWIIIMIISFSKSSLFQSHSIWFAKKKES